MFRRHQTIVNLFESSTNVQFGQRVTMPNSQKFLDYGDASDVICLEEIAIQLGNISDLLEKLIKCQENTKK